MGWGAGAVLWLILFTAGTGGLAQLEALQDGMSMFGESEISLVRDAAPMSHRQLVSRLLPLSRHGQRPVGGSRRRLASGFSTTTFQASDAGFSRVCPAGSSWDDYAALPTGYGMLVADNWICDDPNGSGRVLGISAQDYGAAAYSGWETYGWVHFSVPAKPAGATWTQAAVQGMQVGIIGNVQGTLSGGNCTLTGVDVAIYTSTAGGDPDTLHYSAYVTLSAAQTFSWNAALAGVLHFDLVDLSANAATQTAVLLNPGASYWARIKLHAPISQNSAKCRVFLQTYNTTKTGKLGRWQESAGGALGYSTTCVGAASNPPSIPAATQTLQACFDGGQPGSTSTRRCMSMRGAVSPVLDCPSPFKDFRVAFYGRNVNACSSFPCNSTGVSDASCTDLDDSAPNSAAGRTCTCSESWANYTSEATGCTGCTVSTALLTTAVGGDDYLGKDPLFAQLFEPSGVAVSGGGQIHFSDRRTNMIKKIDGSNNIQLVAGSGASGYSGDNNPATDAKLNSPGGLAFIGSDLYVADTNNHVIRKITAGGTISTVVGTGAAGDSPAGTAEVAGTSAQLTSPESVAAEHPNCGGRLFIVDSGMHRVRVFDPATGNVKNYVGSGQIGNTPGYTVSSGQTPAASLDTPYAVVSTSDCKLYITDAANNVIWSVSGDNVAIYAGQAGSPGLAGDTSNDPTTARFNTPKGIWVDSSSNITYIVDSGNHRIRSIDLNTNTVDTYAGSSVGYAVGTSLTNAQLRSPTSVTMLGTALVITDTGNQIVRTVSGTSVARTAGLDPAYAPVASAPLAESILFGPTAVAAYGSSVVHIADAAKHAVMRSDGSNVVLFAGDGTSGDSGDAGAAASAKLNSPGGVAVSADGATVYISDTGNNRVRRVVGGNIAAYAGTGTAGHAGDNGAPLSATLSSPRGLAVNAAGELFIAVTGSHCVRGVNAAGTNITTVAGVCGTSGSGPVGAATSAQLASPNGVALSSDGSTLFIADTGNNKVRKVVLSTGILSDVAGAGGVGSSGDGAAATAALLSAPSAVAVASNGDVYILDRGNNAVRRVKASNGFIERVVNNITPLTPGSAGDAAANALASRLNTEGSDAAGLAFGASGTILYVTDTNNGVVKQVACT